jgi:hypothetical protein
MTCSIAVKFTHDAYWTCLSLSAARKARINVCCPVSTESYSDGQAEKSSLAFVVVSLTLGRTLDRATTDLPTPRQQLDHGSKVAVVRLPRLRDDTSPKTSTTAIKASSMPRRVGGPVAEAMTCKRWAVK